MYPGLDLAYAYTKNNPIKHTDPSKHKVGDVIMFSKKLSTNKLTIILWLPGFLLAVLWAYIKDGNSIYIFDYIVAFLLFSGMGLVGILWFVRKEAPQGTTLKGKPAMVIGATLAVISFFFAVYTLYLLIVYLLER